MFGYENENLYILIFHFSIGCFVCIVYIPKLKFTFRHIFIFKNLTHRLLCKNLFIKFKTKKIGVIVYFYKHTLHIDGKSTYNMCM